MDTDTPNQDLDNAGKHVLGKWTRVYVHGLLAFVAIYALAYVVTLLLLVFDATGNRASAIVLTILANVVGPPLAGSIILFGVFPLLGKSEGWRGLLGWDDRLISEVTKAKEKVEIVIVKWTTADVRTMGVLTATFSSNEMQKQQTAAYVPTAPQTKFGYIPIVALEDIEFTDWTFRQWQLYQFTFGAASPDQLSPQPIDD